MPAVAEFFYALPSTRRSAPALLAWWERRRLAFNAIVGATGLFSLLVIRLFAWLPPISSPRDVPWLFVAAYALAANMCYTLGFAIEWAFDRWLGTGAPPIGGILFRQGVIFACGLTLLPAFIAPVGWTLAVVERVLHVLGGL